MASRRLIRPIYFLLAAAFAWIIAPQLIQAQQAYNQINLVSDGFVPANTIDMNLKNPWGLVQGPTPFWVSNQVTGTSTLYTGQGTKIPLTVTVSTPATPPPPNGPTGIVFNTGTGFPIAAPSASTVSSAFLFANLNGNIYGWNPCSSAGAGAAEVGVSVSGAVLTGLAINATGSDIYTSNFTASGGIEEFNSMWVKQSTSFTDPSLPSGYEPYNVEDINGTLYVAYEPMYTSGPLTGRPLPGSGNGVVAEFNATTGAFITNLISGGQLDDPWGVALAPSDFGKFSNDLLVGNFGNGWINAFNPASGAFLGTVDNTAGMPIVNSGLWALVFGNGSAGASPDTLYITAGLNNQQDGVLAAINATPEAATLILFGSGLFGLVFLLRRQREIGRDKRRG